MENRQGVNPGDSGKTPCWADEPPEDQGRLPLVILYPRPGRPVDGLVLGSEVCGVMLHWHGRRSGPCWGDDCEVNHQMNRPFWHGYLACQGAGVSGPACLGVSLMCLRQLEELDGLHNGLRGLALRLERTSGVRSRVRVKVLSDRKPKALAPAFDLRALLLLIWQQAGLLPVTAPLSDPKQQTAGRLPGRLATDLFLGNGQGG